ncbi:SdpI family protein [Nocardiopsis gilva]|uniref:SdpI family protein n=1 Tax=Nocardiopsis gilva TaxID=280236 RepID=UPI001268E07F|nr:SdpI family protein [Nocardiopsis gilva]
MEESGALIFAAFGLAAVAGLAHYIRHATANGSLGRNSAIGLRTRITKSSDAAWMEGHREAAPWLTVCAVTGYVISVLTTGVAVVALSMGSVGSAVVILPASGFMAVIVILVIAAIVAGKGGKDAVNNCPEKR